MNKNTYIGALGFNPVFTTEAFAQEGRSGWVYFGYAKNSDLWNFRIIRPASASSAHYLSSLDVFSINNEQVVVQALKEMNVRERPFGTFTGTILNILTPAPPIIPDTSIAIDNCYEVLDSRSVGFSKIWLKINLKSVDCK